LIERGFASHRSHAATAQSTLLSVQTPDGVRPTRLSAELGKRGVVCNTPDGLVRFSPHWPNDADEVPQVLNAIDEAVAEIIG
jgi:hypothetical protein